MKKFIAFCKSYLSEILFALISVLTIWLAVYGIVSKREINSALLIIAATIAQVIFGTIVRSYLTPQTGRYIWQIYFAISALLVGISALAVDNSVGIFGFLWNVFFVALLTYTWSFKITKKPQGPFCVVLNNEFDPLPEPADKLPYVYFDKPIEQKAHTIRYYSPYLGIEKEIPFRPRKERGKLFDDVRGIVVSENLILLRSILFTSNFPDDIREMIKQYDGRLPTETEIKQIYAKFKEINQNLYECGEPLLKKWKYLYSSGNKEADKAMNYCLNFANGEKSLADCDSSVCAVLVETASV